MLKKINRISNLLSVALITVSLLACSNANTSEESSKNDKKPSLNDVSFQRVFPNISFDQTIFMLQAPTQQGRWVAIEKPGKMYWFDATNNDTKDKNLILDLSAAGIELSGCNECGLLGMAFDPEFADNGFVYLSYTTPENDRQTPERMRSVIARFTTTDQGSSLDVKSKVEIFSVLQPYGNHNGGHIAFAADGYLYAGFGDGGSGNDPKNHGQDKTTVLGSMLRLTKDGQPAPGNLLAEQGGAKEIYAWGLRNPWRWSFDQQTQALWVADVGQHAQEEVNIVINGGNYGWRCEEGVLETNN